MSRALNLASRPSRNEILPALLFGLAALLLLGLSLQHARTLLRLRPGTGTPLEQEVRSLEADAARLRSEAAALATPEPDPNALPQWTLLKDLVDRRALRWTELLSVLEETLPAGVRVVSLTPEVRGGRVSLDLAVVARTAEEGLDLLRSMEERREFDGVYPLSVATRQGSSEYRYTMDYRPAGAAAGEAPPAPGTARP